MNKLIYDRLVELARAEDFDNYSRVAQLAGLSMDNDAHRDAISRILREIAVFEEGEGRPMLTAVVVHQGNDNNPGEGFFAAASEFGRYDGSRDPLLRLQFWVRELKAVHLHWSGR